MALCKKISSKSEKSARKSAEANTSAVLLHTRKALVLSPYWHNTLGMFTVACCGNQNHNSLSA